MTALLVSLLPILAAGAQPPSAAAHVVLRIVTVEGRMLRTSSLRIDAAGHIDMTDAVELGNAPGSQPAVVRNLDDLAQIIVQPTTPPIASQGAKASAPAALAAQATFYTAAGGHFRGVIVPAARPAERGATLRLAAGDGDVVTLPLTILTAIQFAEHPSPAAAAEFDARRAAPDQTRDQLVVESAGNVTAFAGSLEQITRDSWGFRIGERTLHGGFDRAVGVVLAGALAEKPLAPAVAHTSNGDALPGRLVSADDAGVQFSLAGSSAVRLRWTDVTRVDLRSRRVLFLSDADPVDAYSQGFFGASWPWQRDRCTAGGPLRIAGREFPKGIGVHARCRLTFAVPAGFSRFAAMCGIDDAGAGRGEVLFRVRGDERTLFETGPVRAGEPPRELSCDVEGVKVIVLDVDFSGGLDLGAHADWGGARLLR